MSVRLLLRLEGGLVLVAAVGAYAVLGAGWGLFVALFLLPYLFMLGYLAGPPIGSAVYNAGHTYAGPLVLAALAYAGESELLAAIALVWAAHIGMDRALGYGLKRPSGFSDTHLSASRDQNSEQQALRRGAAASQRKATSRTRAEAGR